MAAFVVDTNVAVVANGKSHADPACVIACVDALLNVRSDGVIVLDDAMRILTEYMANLSMGGEPGAGDAFMKWVWNVQADDSRCERVFLHSRFEGGVEIFSEFPNDPDLADFDLSDRKFVAVAVASPSSLLKKAFEPAVASVIRNYSSPRANKRRGSS